jgi:hypothetical protein
MSTVATKPLTKYKAARKAKVTPRTIHNWITVGLRGVQLKATKAGAKWLIDPADLDDFYRRLTEAALSRAAK